MNPDFFRLGHIDKARYVKIYSGEVIRRFLDLNAHVPTPLSNFALAANLYANTILHTYKTDMADGVYEPTVGERAIVHRSLDRAASTLTGILSHIKTYSSLLQRAI